MAYKWRALLAVSFGTYMATMDFSIINVALPTLSDEFDRPPDVVIWAALTAALVSTGLTLTAGRAGDLFGRKRIYLGGWIVFGVGLVFASMAPNIEVLIACRAIQAVGVSMAVGTGNAIITEAFPDHERGKALGIVGSVVGAGLMTGPIVGGALLGFGDWRALFYLRIPIVFIAFALAVTQIREPQHADRPAGKLDVPGAVTLFAFLATALLAINRGQAWGWGSPQILGLLAVSVASFAGFIRIETTSRSPVLSLGLFKQRTFSIAVGALVLSFLGQSATLFLMPFYLVEVRGYSTVQTGLILATVPSMMLLLSAYSGQVSDRYGWRHQTTVGIAVVAAGLLSLATLEADTPAVLIMARLAVIGIGSAIFMSPNSSDVMGSVPRSMLGTASASLATGRTVGTSVGLAITGAVLVYVAADAAGLDVVANTRDLPPSALLDGIRASFLVAAALSFLGVVASSMRPPTVRASYGPPLTAPAAAAPPGAGAPEEGVAS
jgi:EmrB/QacA subfamily drug resistance transporter